MVKMGKGLSGGAFLVGIVGAAFFGLLEALSIFSATWIVPLLVISGIIIGLINIGKKETLSFLVAALVLTAGAGILATLPIIGVILGVILAKVAIVAGSAAVVVAVITIYNVSR